MCESSCTDCGEVCQQRRGGRWSRKETEFLVRNYDGGEVFSQIGVHLGRSEDACASKYRAANRNAGRCVNA